MNEKYNKLIYSMILLFIFMASTLIIKNYFKPFIAMVIIIFLSKPLYSILCKFNLFNNRISAFFSILIVNTVSFIAIYYLGSFVINNISHVIYKINFNQTNTINESINGLLDNFKFKYSKIIDNNFLRKGAVYTTDIIVAYFVGNIAAYFIIVDGKYLFKSLFSWISNKKIKIIKDKLEMIKKIVKIELILILITTILTIIGLSILNIKNSVYLGLICGILDLLPYIGTILIFLPLILLKIYEHSFIIAFGLGCLYLLLIICRQILEARFMSNSLNIHPLLILVSLYIGAKLFGVLGLFMGPLYIISTKELILNP